MLACAAMASAWAIPARKGLIQKTGPDGNPIAVEKVGDEFGHHYVDAEGRVMISNGSNLVYATETEIANRMERRKARFEQRNRAVKNRLAGRKAAARKPGQVGTFPGTSFPALGKQKAIVILVEYKDQKFKLGSDAKVKQYFTDMLNKDGFSEQGGTGSVHEYFIDSSNGQFDCDFDVYGPVTLKNNMKYYGGNDAYYGEDLHPEEMVVEACDALDSQVDFSQYDRDGDGYIDNVYVIYAGYGEASYDDEDTVWPHSWSIVEAGLHKTYDGVILDTYGCSNEWEAYINNYAGGPDGIGTFTHEFSHILGLPDLYHTTSDVYYTPGAWSVLDYGPYNNEGRTPPAYSSFERNALGWIDLTELTADAGDVTIGELNATNAAYCITNPSNANEFYLLESRARNGWDTYLPADGMLIWHVDYNTSTWSENKVNNTQNHQGVDLIEADGKPTKRERTGGDCFPGTSKVTSYSPKWWNNSSVGFSLSNIALGESGSITFTVGESGGNSGNVDPTPGDFLTVADIINAGTTTTSTPGVVRGYIVGYANNTWSSSKVIFSANGCTIKTNLVLADTPDETDIDYCIPVQLPNNSCRAELNLQDNPGHIGRYVELVGNVEKYFNQPGFKNVTDYRFISDPQDAIEEVSAPTEAPKGVFDLSGRRVTNPGRGLYIVDGRKVFIR